ncbi:MAG TPA: hypothetical protein ENH91_00110 [Leeuwenhoekiella sp.]|nr:hypothetical protein [Leeuwenhoekiella sp.]
MIQLIYYLLQAENEHIIGDFAEKLGYFIGTFIVYALPIALVIFLTLFLIKTFQKNKKTYE